MLGPANEWMSRFTKPDPTLFFFRSLARLRR